MLSVRNIAKHVLAKTRSTTIKRLCQFYVNTYNNDMDCYFYTNGEYTLAKRILPACQICFDVGANIGDWSAMACKINPQLGIHAFEPSLERSTLFKKRGLPVKINQLGLSHDNEQKTLYYGTIGGSNSLHASITASDKTESIQLTTLDEYCAINQIGQIDFLKIDVEGHEFNVLKGAENFLKQGKIQFIQFEYGPNYIDANILLKNIFDYISYINPNYSFYKVLQNGLLHKPKYDYQIENFLNSTWFIQLKQKL